MSSSAASAAKKARAGPLVFTLQCDGAMFTIDETHIAKVPELVRRTACRADDRTIIVTDVSPAFLASTVEFCRTGVLLLPNPTLYYHTAIKWGIIKPPTVPDELQKQLISIRRGSTGHLGSNEHDYRACAKVFLWRVYYTCSDDMNFHSPRGATLTLPCERFVEHDMWQSGIDVFKYACGNPDLFRSIALIEYGLDVQFSAVFSGKLHKGESGDGVHKELEPALLDDGSTLFTHQAWLGNEGCHKPRVPHLYEQCTTMVVTAHDPFHARSVHEFHYKGVQVQLTYTLGELRVTRMRSDHLEAISLTVYPLATAEQAAAWGELAPAWDLYGADPTFQVQFPGAQCLNHPYMIHEGVTVYQKGTTAAAAAVNAPYALGIGVNPDEGFHQCDKVLESSAGFVVDTSKNVSMVKLTVKLLLGE